MPYFMSDGTRLWFDTGGVGSAPVLLIMGMGVSGIGWLAQVLDLQAEHPVAWFDQRGIGRSELGPRFCGIGQMARDVAALLDHLGWSDAHLVGISMGGMIAQRFALDFRHRTRSLSLIATHAGGPTSAPPTPRALWLMHTSQIVPPHKRWRYLRDLLFPKEYVADPQHQPLLRMAASILDIQAPVRTFMQQLGVVFSHQSRRRLGALQGIPTLIVRPGRDILIPPIESDRLRRRIPGSRMVRFDNAGHGVTAQCSELLDPLLLDHFRSAEQRKRHALQIPH
jgi:pimeloyl-ACP methyl ester carboxylesterase